MPYRVTIYCPDRHLRYEPGAPDGRGIGGGVTARLRLARALRRLGDRVTLVANFARREPWEGVDCIPLDDARRIDADVLILNSTGGALDLSPAGAVPSASDLRLVWVGGAARVGGIATARPDWLVAPSNFIRKVVRDAWDLPASPTFVVFNGVERDRLARPRLLAPRRDPHRLVYVGHPAKGLDAARAVLRLLRRRDRRFELHVYGGAALWGGEEEIAVAEEGVTSHGVIGQRALARELRRSTFTVALQSIPEAFGIAVAEAMAAGNVALASAVGAFPEFLRDGENAYLIAGDPAATETGERTAGVVIDLLERPEHLERLRVRARATPLDWLTIAAVWQSHWDWVLRPRTGGEAARRAATGACAECGGELLQLADGSHCTSCGAYLPRLAWERA